MKIIIAAGVLFLSAIILFLVWQFFFEIYEVKYESELIKNGKAERQIKIKAFPVNGVGRKILFRQTSAKYFFDDSSEVKIIKENQENGIIILEIANNTIPKVTAESRHSLAITKINLDEVLRKTN